MPPYGPGAASSSTVFAPALSVLADPPIRLIDAVIMDYLMIEVVQTLRASSVVATARVKKLEKDMVDAGLLPPPTPAPPPNLVIKDAQRDSTGSMASKLGQGIKVERDPEEEELHSRLEAIGVHVGSNLMDRLCRDRARFPDELEVIKFICKELWYACWDKQIDNLRTNHRGVYVLTDTCFKPLTHISSCGGPADAMKYARTYAAMPAGVLKGALGRYGIPAAVVPEITNIPACTFQLKLLKVS